MSDKKELALVDAEVLTTEEKTELNAEIDRFIEAHKANRKEINRLVFESVAAMTEADEASAQLSNKGFFRRMIGGLTGSNQKLQNKINQSRAAAQYASQQTLQKLAEQNLMSFDLITAVNNKLNASMQSVGEGFQLIFTGLEKFFKQSRNEMVRLEMRLARVERNVKLLTWQSSVEYLEFEGEEYQEMDDARKIVCLVRDFYDITQGEYTTSDLLLLKAAMSAIDIAPKKPVNYGQVITEIAADSALQEKLLGGAGLKPIKDPGYLISMGSLQKLDALHNEESYMVSTVERYLNRTGSDIPRETICHDLASDYMKEKAGVNLDLEVESFDMMLDLLYALKQVEEEHLLGKPKDASLAEAGEVLAAWRDAPSENKKELFSKVLQLAEAGDAAAQFEAGKAYDNGEGVEQDDEEAVKWYRKAAEQGNAAAQNNLAVCYKNGQGVEQDDEEAVKWYRKAAEQGNATAQCNLGYCYKNGQGVEQDYEEAVKWYRKAAEQGYADAQCDLGYCYDIGQGVEQDDEEAVKWYRKAAEQGNATAQCNLGYCYENGQGVEQDNEEAVKWYRRAAEQGNANAQNNLGECYRDGEGVEKNREQAIRWFQKAAKQGYERAQNNLKNI